MASLSKQFFFDSKAVLKAADKKTRTVLSKFGAFTRRTAKGLIRKAKTPAKPGRPPHSHNGLLKKFLYFVYDISRRSVIIGPAKLNGTISDNAPEALEKGGRSRVLSAGRGIRTVKTVAIAPHPYMGPAVAKESKQLPSLWKNSVQ